MKFLIFLIIGLIQGVTEFLPVSSSGHLVLFYQIFNIRENTLFLSVFLHLATLISIIVVYRKEIFILLKNPFCKTNKLLVVSTIPTIIIVLLLKGLIDKSFGGAYLIYGFLATAVILSVSDYLSSKRDFMTENIELFTQAQRYEAERQNIKSTQHSKTKAVESGQDSAKKDTSLAIHDEDITDIKLNYKQAFAIGVAQGCASFPGISRSGSTIATGLLVGGKKEEVTTYSFLMSIPIIIASMFYELLSLDKGAFVNLSAFNMIASFVVAFISGVFAIKFMIRIVKKQSLSNFSFYLVILSFVIIMFRYFG